jgi:hypothetical protein
MDDLLFDVGLGATITLVLVNVADAAAHAFERYALTTPGKADDRRAAKILAATTAVREFTDALVSVLRPFRAPRRRR